MFSGEKNKTFEDKVMQIKALALVKGNDTKAYRDLVVHLYYYYLSRYETALPISKKPKHLEKNVKYDYSKISLDAKKSNEGLSRLINGYDSELEKVKNGGIPEAIYSFVSNCNIELKILKTEIGVTHDIYIDNASKVVRNSTTILLKWIEHNPTSILLLNIQGLKIGNNLLEVCDATFNEINKIEMDEKNRSWFNNKKSSFDIFKEQNKPKGGCFIATACYGNYYEPEVLLLRQYRDDKLLTTSYGKIFVNFYYKVSPFLAKRISKSEILKKFIKEYLLKPIVIKLGRYYH